VRFIVITAFALLVGISSAQSNLATHLVWRARVSVDASGATYRDEFSDGTFGTSVVPFPNTPVSVRLISTNDAGQAWRMDYKATFADGSNVTVRTNSTFMLKPREARMKPRRPELPPMPDWRESAAAVASNRPTSAFAQIAARAVAQEVTRTNLMARPARVTEQHIEAGKLVSKLTDGRVVTNALRKLTTARVASAPIPTPPKDSGGIPLGTEVAGGAAALAAAFAAGRASKKT
jgi:hypothetical protein